MTSFCFTYIFFLRDLVQFVQLKKREKTTLKACNFTQSNTPPWVFSHFLNHVNGTRYQIAQNITYIIPLK